MRTLLDYVIDRDLGRGSSSVVHAARRLPSNETVALKCPAADDESAPATLLREAGFLSRIVHPNVVTLLEVVRMSDTDRPLALALELIPGGTLAQLLTDDLALDPLVVRRIGLDIAQALDAVHRAGIIHTDVTPANILLRADGAAVLTDFDAAIDDGAPPHPAARPPTPSGTAPELQGGDDPTTATDVWALASMLLDALSGPDGPSAPDDLLDALHAALATQLGHRLSAAQLAERLSPPPPPPDPIEPALRPDPPSLSLAEPVADPRPTEAWIPQQVNVLDQRLRLPTAQPHRPPRPRRPAHRDPRRLPAGVPATIAGALLGLVGIVTLFGWANDTFAGSRPSLAGAEAAPPPTLDAANDDLPGSSAATPSTARPDEPKPATSRARVAPRCSSGDPSNPPTDAATVLLGDLDGAGCTRAVHWDPTVAQAQVQWSSGTRRYQLGQPGDQLVLGDWDLDGRDTPGLYRPATGETFLFDGWAEAGAPLPSAEVRATGTTHGVAVVRTAVVGTADHLIVEEG